MTCLQPTSMARTPPASDGVLAEAFAAASFGAESTTREVLRHLDVKPEDRVLEIGFGSGRTLLQVAARAHRGRVVGVDSSEWSLRHARLRTRRLEASGRVQLRVGSSADLSALEEASFDKVYAVHVVYFWREEMGDLAEIRRVLRPGGRLLLGYRPAASPSVAASTACAPVPDVEAALRRADFRSVDSTCRGLGPRLRAWTWASR